MCKSAVRGCVAIELITRLTNSLVCCSEIHVSLSHPSRSSAHAKKGREFEVRRKNGLVKITSSSGSVDNGGDEEETAFKGTLSFSCFSSASLLSNLTSSRRSRSDILSRGTAGVPTPTAGELSFAFFRARVMTLTTARSLVSVSKGSTSNAPAGERGCLVSPSQLALLMPGLCTTL